MKTIKYISALFLAMVGVTACVYDAPEVDSVLLPEDNEAWQPTISIKELIDEYDKKDDLFTIDTIDAAEPLIVQGRIITDDRQGNVYKYFIIQSLDDDHTSLKVSIDAGSLSGAFPLGQVVSIKCNGLVLGRYAGAPQLGVRGYRNDNKIREEPGRIPYSLALTLIRKIGKPEPEKIVIENKTLADISSFTKYDYFKLVRFENVYFTGKDSDGKNLNSFVTEFPTEGQKDAQLILQRYALNPWFAPSTYDIGKGYNIGFPRSREISDGTTSGIYISTSEYARFAEHRIPTPGASNRGTVTAIVGWFQDNPNYDGSWQLTIRSLDDLEGFSYPNE